MQDALNEQLLNILLCPYHAWPQALLIVDTSNPCLKAELFIFSEIFVRTLSLNILTTLIPVFPNFSVVKVVVLIFF